MIQLVSRIISPTSLNTSQTHSISSLMPESCFASILGQFLPNRLWEKSTYERNYWPALLRTKQQQNFVLKDWTWAKVPNMLAKRQSSNNGETTSCFRDKSQIYLDFHGYWMNPRRKFIRIPLTNKQRPFHVSSNIAKNRAIYFNGSWCYGDRREG